MEGIAAPSAEPVQPLCCPIHWPILKPDPALEIRLLGQIKKRIEVQISGFGLMTARHSDDSYVAHNGPARNAEIFLQLDRHVSFDDCAVVKIHLHFEIRPVDLGNNRMRLFLPIWKVTRHIGRVDWLNQHISTDNHGLLGSPCEIGNVGAQCRTFHSGGGGGGRYRPSRVFAGIPVSAHIRTHNSARFEIPPRGQEGTQGLVRLHPSCWRRVYQHLLQVMASQQRNKVHCRVVV